MPPSDRPPSASDEEWARMQEKQLRESTKYMLGEKSLVTRPTRDLNDDRVWSGGSRDFDERTGTNRPRHRGGGREYGKGKPPIDRNTPGYRGDGWNMGRVAPRDQKESKRDWWNEPKKEYRPEKSAKERRMEMLTGGTGTGGRSSYSDRQSLLTGRGLSSNEDRMAMLTGRSDPPKEEWKSQYGGRREYDPQDRKFNRQFDTEPTDNRDVRSQFSSDIDNNDRDYIFYSNEALKNQNYVSDTELKRREMFNEPKRQKGDPTSNESKNPFPYHVFPASSWADEKGIAPKKIDSAYTNQTYDPGVTVTEKYDDSSVKERIRNLENRPQSTGGNWQEDRIKTLEGKEPQDLSGIQGRLSELEGKGPSWQEDRVKQLEGSRSDSKSARNLLDQRISSLENYYKNDPPPADSTGNRYEDKMAALAKGWDMTDKATKWDLEDDRLAGYRNVRDKSGQAWADTLQQGYVQGLRDLNREYNKPVHTANIKGREYKAYDPKAAARLRYLDDQNIHEDTYLGQGTWQNQYGEDVKGWDRGYQDRYFTSQSGLDKDSDEYKKRFGSHFTGDTGKDYAWYQ